jgi:hypothetical protein
MEYLAVEEQSGFDFTDYLSAKAVKVAHKTYYIPGVFQNLNNQTYTNINSTLPNTAMKYHTSLALIWAIENNFIVKSKVVTKENGSTEIVAKEHTWLPRMFYVRCFPALITNPDGSTTVTDVLRDEVYVPKACCFNPHAKTSSGEQMTMSDFLSLSSSYMESNATGFTCPKHNLKFTTPYVSAMNSSARVIELDVMHSLIDYAFLNLHVSDDGLKVLKELKKYPAPKRQEFTMGGQVIKLVNPIFFMPAHHECVMQTNKGKDFKEISFSGVLNYGSSTGTVSMLGKLSSRCNGYMVPNAPRERGCFFAHMRYVNDEGHGIFLPPITQAYFDFYFVKKESTSTINSTASKAQKEPVEQIYI